MKEKKKIQYKIKWVVNPYRLDKRTGPLTPTPMDPYVKYGFEEIEKVFRRK